MSKLNGAQIKKVNPGSIADEVGIEAGDYILEVNSQPLKDIIDYQYLTSDSEILLKVLKKNGEEWLVEIEKDPNDSLGIIFEKTTFDGLKKCHNKCIFCFVDNLPRGLRKSLYVKDDDYRHSFLYGNYITLSNLNEMELQRIVKLKLSPLYVSVHTTNGRLRSEILKNKNAAKIMEQLKYLISNGIKIHTQAVLCPGINDGEHLYKTISDLSSLWPGVLSLALVPVGLTSYNKNPNFLRIFNQAECKKIIDKVEKMQKYFMMKKGTRFVFLADEFYLQAGYKIPEEDYYEGYPQLENGVGIVRLFESELEKALPQNKVKRTKHLDALIITGEASQQILKKAVSKILSLTENLKVEVITVKNNFFGYPVDVTGLLTATDIMRQLNGKVKTGQIIVLPDVMLKEGTQLFLDNSSIKELSENLNSSIKVIPTSGSELVNFLIGKVG